MVIHTVTGMGRETKLRRARIAAGFRSAAALARAVGAPEVTVRAHENGNRPVTSAAAQLYAPVLSGVAWHELMEGGAPIDTKQDSSTQNDVAMQTDSRDNTRVEGYRVPMPVGAKPPDYIPLYAFRGGLDRESLLDTSVGKVERPENLQGVIGAYAIYIATDRMFPAMRPGWLAFVNPHAGLAEGDGVLVRKTDGSVLLREYAGRDNGDVKLRHYRPAEQVTIVPASEIAEMHAIVGYHRR